MRFWNNRDSTVRILVGIAVYVLAGACIEPFDSPTAHDDEKYLCGPENARLYAERLTACRGSAARSEGPCGGVLSFEGTLEGVEVVLDAALDRASLTYTKDEDGDVLGRFEAVGKAPYFAFSLEGRSVGLMDGDEQEVGRHLRLSASAESAAAHLDDDDVGLGLRIAAGGQSAKLIGMDGSGGLDISGIGRRELSGSFTASFGSTESRVHGCFTLLATEVHYLEETP